MAFEATPWMAMACRRKLEASPPQVAGDGPRCFNDVKFGFVSNRSSLVRCQFSNTAKKSAK